MTIDLESLRGILKDEQQVAQMEGPLTDEELASLSEHCCYPDGILDRVIAEHDAQPAPELCGIMRTDTEYLRGLADNENLPILMRDTLRTAAAEIETLRADWVRIEWLADRENTIGNVQLPTMCVMNNMHSLRGAIDEAMRLDPAIWAEIGGADAGETFNAV